MTTRRHHQRPDRSAGFTRNIATLLTVAALVAGCSFSDGGGSTDSDEKGRAAAGDCTIIDVAVSSEKIDLMTSLADDYNATNPKVGDECMYVLPASKASGGAAAALAAGWNETDDGPTPEIWSPASSAWGSIVTQRRGDAGDSALVPADGPSFMRTPLVIAMPQPMAEALGYPNTPVGFADVLRLARDPQGWASLGHPEWGPFKLGKTNPNFSTSGLSELIAQNYAAVGATSGLTLEQINAQATVDFNKGIESAVVHYGDITATFLENWYRADRSGRALTYAPAVAVEEKSVIDYNQGNPDGVLERGEDPTPPQTKLVAIYPSEGTLFSDNPLFVLRADWSTPAQREGAQGFVEFVQRAENQKKVLEFGFRPGSPDVALADPVTKANGLDPAQPATLLRLPSPDVTVAVLDQWAAQRKAARVMFVLDVSGSMGDPVSDDDTTTKLFAARDALIGAADQFRADDEVGLRIFSTELGPNGDQEFIDVLDVEPFGARGEGLRTTLSGLSPQSGTPLYAVTEAALAEMQANYDPTLINAIVLLTDGQNSDGDDTNDAREFNDLLSTLDANAIGEGGESIPIFTIAYGADADAAELAKIADASNGAAYSAAKASSIDAVLTSVISNF